MFIYYFILSYFSPLLLACIQKISSIISSAFYDYLFQDIFAFMQIDWSHGLLITVIADLPM
jgi:hypothetical protein